MRCWTARLRPVAWLCAVVVFVTALSTAACGPSSSETPEQPFYPASEASFQQEAAAQDSVLAVLRALDVEAMQNAFARLADYAFTRSTRTEQLGEAGRLIAFREQVVRYRRGEGARRVVTLRSDSAGTFRFGWLGALVASRVEGREPHNLARHIVPEDPPYLLPRNRELYVYRLLPDTLLNGRATQVAAVRIRSEGAGEQSIRRARFYIDRADERLVGLSLTRAAGSMLFDEESRVSLHLRPAPDDRGAWVPSVLRVRTRLHLPLSAPKHFRTTSTYSDYRPLLPKQ